MKDKPKVYIETKLFQPPDSKGFVDGVVHLKINCENITKNELTIHPDTVGLYTLFRNEKNGHYNIKIGRGSWVKVANNQCPHCFQKEREQRATEILKKAPNLKAPEESTVQKTIEVEDNTLDENAFQTFRSLIQYLTNEQCQKAMRQLILGQSTDDAETAMFARIADYIAFGEKYSDMSREKAVEALKESLTVENLRKAWHKCGF